MLLRTAELAERVWGDARLAAELGGGGGSPGALRWTSGWRTGYYALALDGEGRQVDSVSSSAGHLLWSGIVPEEKARAVADLLLDERLFGG